MRPFRFSTFLFAALLLVALASLSGRVWASHAHLNYPNWWKPVEETPVIHAPAPANLDARVSTFDHRNDPENIKKLAESFFAQMDLNKVRLEPDYVRLDAWGRNEMRWTPPPPAPPSIKNLLADGKYQEALDTYRDFFFRRLLSPPKDYPIEPVHPLKRFFIEFIHLPDELLNQNVARFTMLDDKGLGAVVRVDIGAPGRVNWTFVPPGYRSYDDMIFSPTVNFMVSCGKQPQFFDTLLKAYMDTGNKDYVEKWAAFQDDRDLNLVPDATANPLDKSPGALGSGAPVVGALALWLEVFNHLDYVARRRPEIVQDLPSETLARLILQMWEGASINIRGSRASSNNRSVDMYSTPTFEAALAFPEFHQASYYIRERVRTLERFPTVTMMPDGSDIENEIGYDAGYINTAAKTRDILLNDSTIRPPSVDAQWMENLQHNIDLRVQFLLFMKLNNGWDFYPSHYKVSSDFTGTNPRVLPVAPEALVDPVNQAVISMDFGDGSGPKPPFRSVAWPYAGKYLVRSGWDKNAEVLYMQSPRPYSTSTWKNANDIQLFGFGQPLLTFHTEGYGYNRGGYAGDGVVSGWEGGYREEMRAKYKDTNPDMKGLYQWEFTPVFVDESPQIGQENYKFLPQTMRDDPKPMYGRGAEMANQTPLENRWYESPRFNFTEGEYAGPFGKMDGSHFIFDVSHRRQILFCREAGLWLVWDRLKSPTAHDYRLEWKFAQPFISDDHKPVPGFLPAQIHPEANGHILRTSNAATANLTIAMQSESKLTPSGTSVTFSGSGTVLSFLYPRRNIATDIKEISPLTGTDGQTGFRARTPDGYQVEAHTTSSPSGASAHLKAGSIHAEAESLIVVTAAGGHKYGIVLGNRGSEFAGATLPERVHDFEFDLSGSTASHIQPIYTPLERPTIEPAADRFTDNVSVTLSHPVPGVQLRYTLDGTDPRLTSPLYTGPIKIERSTIVRARAFRPGVKEMPAEPDATMVSAPLEADYVRQAPVTPAGGVAVKPSLAYTYYEGNWALGADIPPGVAPVGQGEVTDLFDMPGRSANSGYLYNYTGYLNIPKDGVYSFHQPVEMSTPSVDCGYDLRLWLNNEEWSPNTSWHNYATWSVPLKKGLYPFRVAYVDWRKTGMSSFGANWLGDKPTLKVSGPGMAPQAIPAAWLCH